MGFQEKLKYNHIILKELEYLNLSYNDLCTQKSTKSSPGSLSVFLSPKFGLFQESLESLYLVNVGINKHQENLKFLNSLSYVTNLYEIDLSENKALLLSDFLKEARDVCCNLETVVFADN